VRTPPAPAKRGVLRRVGQLRHTSPGRFQLILGALIVLGLLTALAAGLTGRATAAGTGELGDRAQPLLVEAETIYTGLADADTTAGQAFLAGGLEPAQLTERYNADLDRATKALAEAARLAPEGSRAAQAVQTLAAGIPRYAALVATARADNRQGLPVGASYLSAAADFNQDTLRPEAQELFRIAQREVTDGYSSATSAGWVAVFVLLLLVLLGALLLAQRHLSRVTHRTFNVPLVAATALTLLLALGAATILLRQHSHLGRAADTGSQPAAQLAEARIAALQMRSAEALTLAARGSNDKEKDFTAADQQLTAALNNRYLAGNAREAHRQYTALHARVRTLDQTDGDYDGAVKLAIGTETGTAFTALTGDIGAALDHRKAAFTDEIGAAGRGLGLLTVLGPLAALLVCALAAAGIRARLEEYR
jgi:hypothetical protein